MDKKNYTKNNIKELRKFFNLNFANKDSDFNPELMSEIIFVFSSEIEKTKNIKINNLTKLISTAYKYHIETKKNKTDVSFVKFLLNNQNMFL